MKIGVLALQGGFEAHARMLRKLGAETVYIRKPDDFAGLEGLVLPGGESTTMDILIENHNIHECIIEYCRRGLPVLATCAGVIILDNLGILKIEVERNAYGSQVRSFEADLEIASDINRKFRGIFIRAPIIRSADDDIGVLSRFDGNPVMIQKGSILAMTFHPELTDDSRIHRYGFCLK